MAMKECRKQANERWRKRNLQHCAEYAKTRYASNPDLAERIRVRNLARYHYTKECKTMANIPEDLFA